MTNYQKKLTYGEAEMITEMITAKIIEAEERSLSCFDEAFVVYWDKRVRSRLDRLIICDCETSEFWEMKAAGKWEHIYNTTKGLDKILRYAKKVCPERKLTKTMINSRPGTPEWVESRKMLKEITEQYMDDFRETAKLYANGWMYMRYEAN